MRNNTEQIQFCFKYTKILINYIHNSIGTTLTSHPPKWGKKTNQKTSIHPSITKLLIATNISTHYNY